MATPTRPSFAWIASVVVLLAAAVAGLASWIYAKSLEHSLGEEWMPIPWHVGFLTTVGIILMLLGGLGALTMLALRHRALTRAA